VFKDREPRKAIEVVYSVDNSIDSQNTNLDWKAIHIHGGMENKMIEYAKYYSCGHTEILGGIEFTKETNHSRRDFFGHW
jgi:hypothetical protein